MSVHSEKNKSLLVLRHLCVENANAINGLTYGFPAVSGFLGFVNSMSIELEKKFEGVHHPLSGCAIIVHDHQIHGMKANNYSDFSFALSRNPLKKDAKPAGIVEEGRMTMDVSLIIPCTFDIDDLPDEFEDEDDIKIFFNQWLPGSLYRHLAGGIIKSHGELSWRADIPTDCRQLMRSLLPGFALLSRHDYLQEHHQQRCQSQENCEILDSLLDYVKLQYRTEISAATSNESSEESNASKQGKYPWQYQPRPHKGYLVPLMVGYQGISPLYECETNPVKNARNIKTDFRFVEAIYSLSEWINPLKISDLEQLFWHYEYSESEEYYLCKQNIESITSLSM